MEIVLRQGLVHPITCVPYLIALETDPEEANSKLAHHLLMNMNEKYVNFCKIIFFLCMSLCKLNSCNASGIQLSAKAVSEMAFSCRLFSFVP